MLSLGMSSFLSFRTLADISRSFYSSRVNTKQLRLFDELPNQKQWDHTIELVPNACNFSTKVYPLAPVEQKQLDKFLNENLKSQSICPSKSPMASLVFFIKKKDGSLHLVQD